MQEKDDWVWQDDVSGPKLSQFSAEDLRLPGILTFGSLGKLLHECKAPGEDRLILEREGGRLTIYPRDPTLSTLSYTQQRTLLVKDFGARHRVEVRVSLARTGYREVVVWEEKNGFQNSLDVRLGAGTGDSKCHALLVRSQRQLDHRRRCVQSNIAGLGFNSRTGWQMVWNAQLPLDVWAAQFPPKWAPHFLRSLSSTGPSDRTRRTASRKPIQPPGEFRDLLEDELRVAWRYLRDYGQFVRGYGDTLNSLLREEDGLRSCFQATISLTSDTTRTN